MIKKEILFLNSSTSLIWFFLKKKILLISYFFPPANFVGAQRTAFWAENLHKQGYYPIVITRQWNENQTTLTEKVVNNELEVEKCDGYEVHRLPYKESLRDRLDRKGKYKLLQKALTLKEIVLSNFSIAALPYSNFYAYAKSLIQSDSEIGIVIASGRPFQSFAIGHQLKKDFPNIHWIPDYRDEWTTHLTITQHSFLRFFEKKSELKWTSNSSLFIGTSSSWVNRISHYLYKPGKVVINGFVMPEKSVEQIRNEGSVLDLIYAGSVYNNQSFDVFFESVGSIKNEVKVTFIGIEHNQNKKKEIEQLAKQYELHVSFRDKCDSNTLKAYYSEADLLFLTELENHSDWLPVKLFDYFQTGKPILLCPSDNDVMGEFIRKTNSGYIANTVEECKQILKELLDKKQRGESIAFERNMEEAYFYSREYQTKKLAEILDSL